MTTTGLYMAELKLLNYAGANGEPRPALLAGGEGVIGLQEALPGKGWATSTLAVLVVQE